MLENSERIRQHDDKQINIKAPYAIRNWCSLYEVTREELIAAVDAVGTTARDVRKYLMK
ncbi:MAG TPA: DUF3606 domain-containing protein [Victivallales bacterium]|nr:DUF3606 domain-containing protein [Victivallales bacterium]